MKRRKHHRRPRRKEEMAIDPQVRFTVLMPDKLRKQLDEVSNEIGISRNGLIVHLLTVGMEFGEAQDKSLFPGFDRFLEKVVESAFKSAAGKAAIVKQLKGQGER